jgi:hypothetical protein
MIINQKTTGQTFLEYCLLIGIVAGVVIAISPMVKRATQGMIKLVSDQVGNQVNAEQDLGDDGYLEETYSLSTIERRKRIIENMGTTEYMYNGTEIRTESTSTSNLGFSEREE